METSGEHRSEDVGDVPGAGAVLRSLISEDDFERCLELQRETWGQDFRELVPPTMLSISQKVGGVLVGAFDGSDGPLLGFVYGLTGVRDGELAHWSHMLAVTPSARGRGIGRALKIHQRARLQDLGVGVMYWTYDPLIARNATLNLVSLGARPVEYVADMYGPDTGSELHSGLGTDRFVVRWRLDGSAPERQWAAAPGDGAETTDWGLRRGPRRWVEIPLDIDELKVADPEAARDWRRRTRECLGGRLEAGDRCLGLWTEPRTGRIFYLFEETPET